MVSLGVSRRAAARGRHADRIVPISAPVGVQWGRLVARGEAKGVNVPVIDALIGATAIVHQLMVVTRNTSDITRTGAPILDPWP